MREMHSRLRDKGLFPAGLHRVDGGLNGMCRHGRRGVLLNGHTLIEVHLRGRGGEHKPLQVAETARVKRKIALPCLRGRNADDWRSLRGLDGWLSWAARLYGIVVDQASNRRAPRLFDRDFRQERIRRGMQAEGIFPFTRVQVGFRVRPSHIHVG